MEHGETLPDGERAHTYTRRQRIHWTKAMKAQFLDHLVATCNIKASGRAIGLAPESIYGQRRRDPAFAAAWDEALVHGYQLLETRLVGHALAGGHATDGDSDLLGPLDVAFALNLLHLHRAAVKAPSRTPRGAPRGRATRAETDASILRKLAAMEKRLGIVA